MKILILLILIWSPIFISPQSSPLTLFDEGINYNGTELITDEVNRTFESTQLFINGDCETGSFVGNWAGWNTPASVVVKTDTVYGGSYSAKITTTTDAAVEGTSQSKTTVSGSTYICEGWLNYDSGDQVCAFIYASGGMGYVKGTLTNNTSGWVFSSVMGTTTATTTTMGFGKNGSADVTIFYVDNATAFLKNSNYTTNGNHIASQTTYISKSGSYSGKIISSGAGNGSTNTISLASALFTAVTSGTNYRFQIYAYSPTTGTTLTLKLGDIVLTKDVSTSGMTRLDFDFKATASSTGNICLYTNQASTIYLDEASLKSGQ